MASAQADLIAAENGVKIRLGDALKRRYGIAAPAGTARVAVDSPEVEISMNPRGGANPGV